MTAATQIRVEDNERLVHWYLKRKHCERWLRSGAVDYSDLAQAGRCGLMKAIEKFDPERGVTFATYALHWIRQAVTRELENHDGVIHLPVYIQARRRRAGKSQRPRVASLDAPVRGARSEDSNGSTLGDLIAGDAPLPDAGTEHSDRARLLAQLMAKAKLSRVERVVLRERFGDREPTLDDLRPLIGNVSRERVRQLQESGLAKLRGAAQRMRVDADAA